MNQLNHTLSKVAEAIIYVLLIGIPLLFLPFSQSAFDSVKLGLIIFATLALAGLWLVKILTSSHPIITIHPFILPLTLLIIAIVVSAVTAPLNVAKSLSGVYGAIFF